jgi:hypothetical protein
MSDDLTFLQFQSPWQGRTGFERFNLDMVTGDMTSAKNAKTKKLMRKGQKNIDGLVLFPTWPTKNGLIVMADENSLRLTEIKDGHVEVDSDPILTSDPAFKSQISERLLYRKFSFSNAARTIRFSDLSARLMTSSRTAYEVFPTPDFSPFARLLGIINHEESHQKLIADLHKGRFDYPSWSDNVAQVERDELMVSA